ncbi:MAG: hypothetical protein Q9212_000126 [Teloschistes hypoglaucus]
MVAPNSVAVLDGDKTPVEEGSISPLHPHATFEVSDAPLPLLHISLSASQNLYTRRGTLVGVGGKADNVSERILNHTRSDMLS